MPAPIDYAQSPLGSLPGEQGLQAPYNQGRLNVIVSVRNLSAVNPRRVVDEYVSFRRGGSLQLNSNKKYAQAQHGNTSVDELRLRAGGGENMNLEDDRIEPIDFIIRHDSKRYLIPAIDAVTGESAPWITVEPGVWDLYCGNYERMHSTDRRERVDEIQLLAGRGNQRFAINPDDADDERPYAFLEFRREEIKLADVMVDAQRVRAGKLIEV